MTTLDRLKHLSEMGTVICCPQMTLLAGDHEPPVVVGEGEITVLNATSFAYTLRGLPNDVGHALRSLRRIDVDPYDGLLRERLTVTTADGLTLMGGWTIPKVRVPDDGGPWVFKGEIEALSFMENGTYQAGTEAAYLLPRQHRARIILRRFFPRIVGEQLPEVRLTVLGSDVIFTLDDEADLLLVRAPATAALPPCQRRSKSDPLCRRIVGVKLTHLDGRSDCWPTLRPTPPSWASPPPCACLSDGSSRR